jgi:hypothetical protein
MLDLNGSGLTPRTIRGLAPVEMELYLPAMSEPIRIRQAKFREHPDQFKGSGVRGESGIGIEFIDISKEHMGRLARFIRGKDELDAGRPPGNAPWLSPASTTAAPPPGASPALPDVASPA